MDCRARRLHPRPGDGHGAANDVLRRGAGAAAEPELARRRLGRVRGRQRHARRHDAAHARVRVRAAAASTIALRVPDVEAAKEELVAAVSSRRDVGLGPATASEWRPCRQPHPPPPPLRAVPRRLAALSALSMKRAAHSRSTVGTARHDPGGVALHGPARLRPGRVRAPGRCSRGLAPTAVAGDDLLEIDVSGLATVGEGGIEIHSAPAGIEFTLWTRPTSCSARLSPRTASSRPTTPRSGSTVFSCAFRRASSSSGRSTCGSRADG